MISIETAAEPEEEEAKKSMNQNEILPTLFSCQQLSSNGIFAAEGYNLELFSA